MADPGDGQAVVNFSAGDVTADLSVDAEGLVTSYPGLARRVTAPESVGG